MDMFPLEKAIGDIQPGIPAPEFGATALDYSHVLEPEHHKALPGARIISYHHPDNGTIGVTIRDNSGERLAYVNGELHEPDPMGRKAFRIIDASSHGWLPQRGDGGVRLYWGRKMYEVAMAHAKALGATHVVGGEHSSLAHKTHKALAEKHGLDYDPQPNIEGHEADPSLAQYLNIGVRNQWGETDWDDEGEEPYDDKWGPYQFTLKSEIALESFSKAESLGAVKIPNASRTSDEDGIPYAQYFDYSHLLSQEQRDKGYGIELKTVHPRSLDNPPLRWSVAVTHPSKPDAYVGILNGHYLEDQPGRPLLVDYANVKKEHRKQHLGRAAYESVIAHFVNNHDARMLKGSVHSSSAHATHKAIMDKYGLNYVDPPVPQTPVEWDDEDGNITPPEDPNYGAFDSSFKNYSIGLHKTEGLLAKTIVEDQNDEVVRKLMDPAVVVTSNELHYWIRSADWNENRMAAALKYRPTLIRSVVATVLRSPMLTRDAWEHAFHNADGSPKLETPQAAMAHSSLLEDLAESGESDVGAPWIRSDLGFFYIEALAHTDFAAAHPDLLGNALPEDRAKAMTKVLLKLASGGEFNQEDPEANPAAFNAASLLNDEMVRRTLPIDHTLGPDLRFARTRAIKGLAAYADSDEATKVKLLNYAKGLFDHLERFSSDRTSAMERIQSEVNMILPTIQKVVSTGVPESVLKKTRKAGLFQAVLSHAPNFPKRTFNSMMEKLSSPDAKQHKVAEIAKLYKKTLMASPHSTPDSWASIVKGTVNMADLEDMASDPRWNDDLSKFAFDKFKESGVVDALAHAGKLTPDVAKHIAKNIGGHDPEAQARIDRTVTALQAAQDPQRDVSSGVFKEGRWTSRAHPMYQDNPNTFRGEVAKRLARQMQAATPGTFSPEDKGIVMGHILDAWEKQAFYQHHSGLHPDAVIRTNPSLTSLPWTMAGAMGGNIPTATQDRLVDLLVHHDIFHNNRSSLDSWLSMAPLTPDNYNKILKSTVDTGVLGTLMNRPDFTSEHLDTIMNRPEFDAPISPTDTRFLHDESQNNYLERPLASDFPRELRRMVMPSDKLSSAQIQRLLVDATPNDIARLAYNPRFDQACLNALLAQTPTEYTGTPMTTTDAQGVQRHVVDHEGNLRNVPATPGTTSRSPQQHAQSLGYAMNNHPDFMTPEVWAEFEKWIDRPMTNHEGQAVPNPLHEEVIGIDSTPTSILDKVWNSAQAQNDDWIKQRVLGHQNARPEWVDDVINSGSVDGDLMTTVINKPNLTDEQLAKIISRTSGDRMILASRHSKFGELGLNALMNKRPDRKVALALGELLQNEDHDFRFTPEVWTKLKDQGLLEPLLPEGPRSPGLGSNHLLAAAAKSDKTPDDVLERIWTTAPNLQGSLLEHPRAKQEWVDSAIDTYERFKYATLAKNPTLSDEQLARMVKNSGGVQPGGIVAHGHAGKATMEALMALPATRDTANGLKHFIINHDIEMTPEMWDSLYASEVGSKPTFRDAYGNDLVNPVADATINSEHAPVSALTHVWNNLPNMRSSLLKNPRALPEWVDQAIDAGFDYDTYKTLLGNPNLTPEQVHKLETNAVSAVGPIMNDDGSPHNRYANVDQFWADFADSKYGDGQWADNLAQRMMAHDNAGLTSTKWKSSTFGQKIFGTLERSDPDRFLADAVPVKVKVGSHALRGIRDLILAEGKPIHYSKLPALPAGVPPYADMQIVAPMTDEEWAKIPEKQRQRMNGVRPMKKSGLIPAEAIQKVIDELPERTVNVVKRPWGYSAQSDTSSAENQIFQVNITTDTANKIKAAGLWDLFAKHQKTVFDNHAPMHPLRESGTTLGWVRHFPINPASPSSPPTVQIHELQSDIRPPGLNWVTAVQRGIANGSSSQFMNDVRRTWPGNTAPLPKLAQLHDIIFGPNGDPHELFLEAFHQHLRDQGQTDTVVHLANEKMRAQLSGQSREKPVPHFLETYRKMPKAMQYAIDAAPYGTLSHQTGSSYKQPGNAFHTSPVRKFEDILQDLFKAIGKLPDQPIVKRGGRENHYDASAFLHPQHRDDGYRMRIRSSPESAGPWMTAEIFHGDEPIGGATGEIDLHRIKDGKTCRNMSIDFSDIMEPHRNKGLGLAMYEALLSHGRNVFGATHVIGSVHSSMAHRVHQKLAEKHGLKYESEPHLGGRYNNEAEWRAAASGPADGKYGNYRYTIEPSEG